MKIAKLAMYGILSVLITSCGLAYMQNKERLMSTATEKDYGTPIPQNSDSLIRQEMEYILKDPTSAQYKFTPGETKYAIQKSYSDPEAIAVRLTTFYVNAKNSYGGYGGFKLYKACWKDGKIIAFIPERGINIYINNK